jgi:hypothetical protein
MMIDAPKKGELGRRTPQEGIDLENRGIMLSAERRSGIPGRIWTIP